ncbi:hypothetical protein V1478_007911 [Vespula squamosa]|uniref:Uncharacterized protein n=1 Tax=Vespula squamosa TaxID=30214 RepID=A0ABD2AX87_VESSQ
MQDGDSRTYIETKKKKRKATENSIGNPIKAPCKSLYGFSEKLRLNKQRNRINEKFVFNSIATKILETRRENETRDTNSYSFAKETNDKHEKQQQQPTNQPTNTRWFFPSSERKIRGVPASSSNNSSSSSSSSSSTSISTSSQPESQPASQSAATATAVRFYTSNSSDLYISARIMRSKVLKEEKKEEKRETAEEIEIEGEDEEDEDEDEDEEEEEEEEEDDEEGLPVDQFYLYRSN